jgi:hypothetical protein
VIPALPKIKVSFRARAADQGLYSQQVELCIASLHTTCKHLGWAGWAFRYMLKIHAASYKLNASGQCHTVCPRPLTCTITHHPYVLCHS